MTPRPRAEYVPRLYDERYFYGKNQFRGIGYQDYLATDRAAVAARRAEIGERLRVVRGHYDIKDRAVLEIGCATGDFSVEAARRGARATGIDISAEIIDVARRRHPQVEFVVSTAEDLAGDDREFDAICAFEVIEHVLSPVAFAAAIRSLCRPGGIVAISTPNVAESEIVGKDLWLGFNGSFEHLFFFSPVTLDALMSHAGFQPIAHYAAGTGLEATPVQTERWARIKGALEAVQLLDWATRVKLSVSPPRTERFGRGSRGHRLFALYGG